MIDFRKVRYLASYPDYRMNEGKRLPEVAFFGRSNVGKSSLINALTGVKIAYSSKSAGKTKYLNYFLLDDSYYLVDTPGYGYTAYGNKEDISFSEMMEGYMSNPNLALCVLILDSRREPNGDDLLLLDLFKKEGKNTLIVYSKGDLVGQKEKAQINKRELGLPYLIHSKGDSPLALRKEIASRLP